jgi:ATP-dependent Clp protease ATP-binding subunit ClpA
VPSFSRELELTLHRALACANQRDHEYATLEHLLLALIEDTDAAAVMKARMVNLGALKESLTSYIDKELKTLAIADCRDATPTPAFQRVVQRAALCAQGEDRDAATTLDILRALFDETESHAAWLLVEQGMGRPDALEQGMVQEDAAKAIRGIEQGAVRQSFSHARTKPVVVVKVKRRAASADGRGRKISNGPPSSRPR